MKIKNLIPLIITLSFFTACEEKAEPIIMKKSNLMTPLPCLKLATLQKESEIINHLQELYPFKKSCDYTLTLSYKKDILCNSNHNIALKTTGKFPKSFVKIEVHKGLTSIYSYYVDLYSNVDNDDVEEGFQQLKEDLLISQDKEILK